MYLVYKHTSPSGKSYIGITNDYDRRCREHQTRNDCRIFHRAIKKYGWDNFTHEFLYENITEAEAVSYEQTLVQNTIWPRGYNIVSGGGNSVSRRAVTKRIKTYKVTSPSGYVTVITNLSEFCKENSLTMSAMAGVANGKCNNHKGWLCQHITDDTVYIKQQKNHNRNKQWLLTSPDGICYTVDNLIAWCKERELSPGCLRRVATGDLLSYKGWTCSVT